MSIAHILEPIPAAGGAVRLDGLDHWLQGRTLYGGASALIAYTAAVRAFPELPPLRAAQVAFVAPTGPEVELRREIVRQGRNVAQVRSEIWCEGKCTLTAFWLFGTSREPNAVHPAAPVANWPGPAEDAEPTMVGKGPEFIQHNFELRRAQEIRGKGEPTVRRWARLRDREGLDPISELILLGDVQPPGAMRAMQQLARSARSTGRSTCWTLHPRRLMAGGYPKMPASTPMMAIPANACGCGMPMANKCWTDCNAWPCLGEHAVVWLTPTGVFLETRLV